MVAKGQKSVRWDMDPDILLRLEQVNLMLVRGARLFQIAEALGVSMETAVRDVKRVAELRRRQSEKNIAEAVAESVAQYETIITECWKQYEKGKSGGQGWLREIRENRKRIDELLGIEAPKKIAPTNPDGDKPYEGDIIKVVTHD